MNFRDGQLFPKTLKSNHLSTVCQLQAHQSPDKQSPGKFRIGEQMLCFPYKAQGRLIDNTLKEKNILFLSVMSFVFFMRWGRLPMSSIYPVKAISFCIFHSPEPFLYSCSAWLLHPLEDSSAWTLTETCSTSHPPSPAIVLSMLHWNPQSACQFVLGHRARRTEKLSILFSVATLAPSTVLSTQHMLNKILLYYVGHLKAFKLWWWWFLLALSICKCDTGGTGWVPGSVGHTFMCWVYRTFQGDEHVL